MGSVKGSGGTVGCGGRTGGSGTYRGADPGETLGETLEGDPGGRPWGETLGETLEGDPGETLAGDPGETVEGDAGGTVVGDPGETLVVDPGENLGDPGDQRWYECEEPLIVDVGEGAIVPWMGNMGTGGGAGLRLGDCRTRSGRSAREGPWSGKKW